MRTLLTLLLGLSVGPALAAAQCGADWLPGLPLAGADDTVTCSRVWDPDGPGPLPAKLVIGGLFRAAGDQAVEGLATWDGAAWGRLGPNSGPGSLTRVTSIAVTPAGDLVAVGTLDFGERWPIAAARWTGSSWALLGPEPDGVATHLAAGSSGLYASFRRDVGSYDYRTRIARWNGDAWQGLGEEFVGQAGCLAVSDSGVLHAGGPILHLPGSPSLFAFASGAWSPVGDLSGSVSCLNFLPDGRILAGGFFPALASGGARLAAWNGVAWSAPVDTSRTNLLSSIDRLADGRLAVTGWFNIQNIFNLILWDGASWTGLSNSGGVTPRFCCACSWTDGRLIVGGEATGGYPQPYRGIAKHNGTTWAPLTPAAVGTGRALRPLRDGGFVLGGTFTAIPGTQSPNIARWTGAAWQGLGTGISGAPSGEAPGVSAILELPDGDLIAAGYFTLAGSRAARSIARWNGSTWTALGRGIDGGVFALALLPDGRIVAGGLFSSAGGVPAVNVAIWNGAAWSAMGSLDRGRVWALLALPDGRVVIGGEGEQGGGCVSIWDGAAWTGTNQVHGAVTGLATSTDGRILASGSFTVAGEPNRDLVAGAWWDGAAWHNWGYDVYAQAYGLNRVAPLPDGEVLFGLPGERTFTRSRHGTWLRSYTPMNAIQDMALLADGRVVVAGPFSRTNTVVSCLAAVMDRFAEPDITVQPQDAAAALDAPVSFTAQAAPSENGPRYRWRRNGAFISPLENHTTFSPTLVIPHAGAADRGGYDCIVSTCGDAVTRLAALSLCVADFNADGLIDFFDLLDFGDAFSRGDAVADLNRDAFIDFFDYAGFVAEFEAGC